MAERVREEQRGSYFAAPSALTFIPSGATVLDCVLGGGWVSGRISNVVGDKSTGKTLLAIEALANFYRRYPEGEGYYREAEAAFDEPYAAGLGMPIDKVRFWDDDNPDQQLETVEDFFWDLEKVVDAHIKSGKPGLYILDSLDALSDREELKREIDKGSYGAAKAKMMSKLFRQLVRKIEKAKISIIIISQIRDNIGVMIGNKYVRSGGKALDFYASQVVYLAHLGQVKKTVKEVERTIGVRIKAKCTKNKVGLPFRECEFEILFGYGIDDLLASCEWLQETKRMKALGVEDDKALLKYIREAKKLPDAEYFAKVAEVGDIVKKEWAQVETSFLPERKKYT